MKEYKYSINGTKYEVVIGDIVENVASVSVNGEDYKVEIMPEVAQIKQKPVVRPAENMQKQTADTPKPAVASAAASAKPTNTQNAVKAPLPGTIIEIKVNVGDEVKAGDSVVVLEAMKMANNLETERAGKVVDICVQPGQSVMEGDALVVIE